uniref:Uncharacterized protein n=1 Tax=Clytia hemisphaerica TaxID=252671 RepID=A0A7M5VD24_9CNID
QQDGFYKPSTISSKLSAVAKFLKFTTERRIFFGLTCNQISIFREQIKTHTKGLSPDIAQRQHDVKEDKLQNLLQAKHFVKFGASVYVKEIVTKLKNREDFNQFDDFAARNILTIFTCFVNGLRASNLMNMSIQDFEKAEFDKEFH